MSAIRQRGQLLSAGKEQEKAGRLEEAASTYEKIVAAEPADMEAVSRLLVIYRKLKEHRGELRVIDAALAAYEQRDKTAQASWLKDHPKAAGAGRAILRKLGGRSASAFGADPAVSRLLKRKEVVEQRLSGKKGRRGVGKVKDRRPAKKIVPKAQIRKAAAEQKKRDALARKKALAQEKAEAAAARKKAAGERKRAAAAQKAKKEKERAAEKAVRSRPSLFVISLRYLVPLEKIDTAMEAHLAFLKKQYQKGGFLVSGRQVPRTGGIIIAAARSRDAVQRIMKQDPLVKRKLASVDIVEFLASQTGKGWPRSS